MTNCKLLIIAKRKAKALARAPLVWFFRMLPLDNRLVVFDNFNGRGYGCNPKYIAEALKDSGLKLVWLAANMEDEFPDYITPVKYGSPTALQALATARVRVDNVRNYKWVPKRDGQLYIQTWHAMVPLKKVEQEAVSSLSKRYVREAMRDGADIDLMIANNRWDEQKYRSSFWYSGEVLLTGLPRMRPLLQQSDQIAVRVRKGLDIPQETNVVLFAPTFRDYDARCIPKFDCEAVVRALSERTGDEWVCAVRLHPNIAPNRKHGMTNAIDVSSWPDMQEILAISNLLITDYSSTAMDAAVAGKPVLLFVPDRDEYETYSREFSMRLEDTPFILCNSFEELINCARMLSDGQMTARYADFFELIGLSEDGEGDERVSSLIVDVCHARSRGATS